MATQSISFTGAHGDQLSARLELPASGRPRATAVFAHCFTCSKNIKAAVNVTRALAREGFAVLRFDFTGLGESQGDFADTNFSSNVEDVVEAARHLGAQVAPPSLLVGHSLGGAAVLQAADHLPSVKAVATIADIYDKTGRSGTMVFIVQRMTFINDRDEKVSTVDWKMIRGA